MTRITQRSVTAAFHGLAATWRFEIRGGSHLARVSGAPFVFALWHHTLLPLLWWHRHRSITLLVSRHRDGELVARAAAGIGYRLARGSSTRGGVSGYRELLRALASGSVVAVTPDGPAGPAGIVKPGAVRAAHRAEVPVLPVAARVDRAWRLRSWDRLVIPQPFARIVVEYGRPVAPHADTAAACATLGRALDSLLPVRSSEAA
jgi:hypothetical protein